ncbi:hypothetical protein [Methanohalophilus sp.]|uniref:hypothetical protein n=1 Tax=Methanohalophilus sp. TaxID=1966352 RepID=UPI0026132069|nr:hypothetical protein [Methanohalophilus sp.]MDK2892628.1 hypothetical protein [Methanohalophilus sp.]
MDKCIICGEPQDYKIYSGYNICTTCADVMEDVMGEYFLRTIHNKSKPKSHEGYLKYLSSTSKYISDYKKITQNSKKYVNTTLEKAGIKLENTESPSRQRYFERMQSVLKWLSENIDFYHYYFKKYYVCPSCGSSIFDSYSKEEVGDWLIITCSKCGEEIKKYYSQKTA